MVYSSDQVDCHSLKQNVALMLLCFIRPVPINTLCTSPRAQILAYRILLQQACCAPLQGHWEQNICIVIQALCVRQAAYIIGRFGYTRISKPKLIVGLSYRPIGPLHWSTDFLINSPESNPIVGLYLRPNRLAIV